MVPRSGFYLLTSALLCGLLPIAAASAHSDDHHAAAGMDMGDMGTMQHNAASNTSQAMEEGLLSYMRLGEHTGWIYWHIIVMTVTWTMILPLATVCSVAQSRFAFPSQLIFIISNSIGLFLGTVYNAKTPDLYENNAHHKLGWVITWFAAAWIILGVLNLYAARFARNSGQQQQQISVANMARYKRLQLESESPDRRWSGDSGQGTERNSASLFGSGSQSPSSESETRPFEDQLPLYSDENEGFEDVGIDAEKSGFLSGNKVDRFLRENVHRVSGKILNTSKVIYIIFERLLVVLGFVALLTGVVTFGGLFRGPAVFNGLAHWIKGGIFFWYGLLTLGRWMGAYADFGWAWNVRPGTDLVPRWKTRIPSAEFVESFVIALYGITNVWLEHLAAWGSEWAPQDLEHVSITILFFGGGVLGMLIESTWIRNLLSTHILSLQEEAAEYDPSTTHKKSWNKPQNYHVPLNPMPGLVIMLLGIMMSSHTQESMTSSMIHKQWGQLFVGYALARGVTYLLLYVRPYSSYLPARPPTEIVASFCLVGGGLVFMASSRDVVQGMEYNGLDAMFGFTVTMGLTALIMAWVVILLALKGWLVRKEKASLFRRGLGAA